MRKLLIFLVALVALFLSAGSVKPPMSVDSIQRELLDRPWATFDEVKETPEARKKRSRVMSQSLFDTAKEFEGKRVNQKVLVAAVMSIWWWETRYSLEVHQGGLSRFGSDDGLAKCFGQIHVASVGIEIQEGETLEAFRERQAREWEQLSGTDYESTRRCARATMVNIEKKLRKCWGTKNRWENAFGAYGTGGACAPLPTSGSRARLTQKLANRL